MFLPSKTDCAKRHCFCVLFRLWSVHSQMQTESFNRKTRFFLSPITATPFPSIPFIVQLPIQQVTYRRNSLPVYLLRQEIHSQRAFNQPCQVRERSCAGPLCVSSTTPRVVSVFVKPFLSPFTYSRLLVCLRKNMCPCG